MQTNTSPSGGLLLASLQQRLPKQTFDTWFRSLTVDTSPGKHVVTVSAPNRLVKEWVAEHYTAMIEQLLGELSLGHYKVEWATKSSAINESELKVPAEPRVSAREIPIESVEEIPAFVEATPSPLNERYNFANFVVASCNRFAHAAAKAVADAPGQTYNPLYLYGGVGLGKTHLIQATGDAIKTIRPDLQIA